MCIYNPENRKKPYFNELNTYYDYFEYEGNKYPLNTVVTIKKDKLNGSYFLGIEDKQTVVLDHYLDCRGKHIYYVFKNYTAWDEPYCYVIEDVDPNDWIDKIITQNEVNIKKPYERFVYDNDSEVDDVIGGWIIYIITMISLFIFKDRWIGWILASVFFFNWRRKKLQRKSWR